MKNFADPNPKLRGFVGGPLVGRDRAEGSAGVEPLRDRGGNLAADDVREMQPCPA